MVRFIKQRVGFQGRPWWGGSVAEEHGLGLAVATPSQKGESVGSAALGNLVCAMQMDTEPENTGAYC